MEGSKMEGGEVERAAQGQDNGERKAEGPTKGQMKGIGAVEGETIGR